MTSVLAAQTLWEVGRTLARSWDWRKLKWIKEVLNLMRMWRKKKEGKEGSVGKINTNSCSSKHKLIKCVYICCKTAYFDASVRQLQLTVLVQIRT